MVVNRSWWCASDNVLQCHIIPCTAQCTMLIGNVSNIHENKSENR